MSSAIRLSGCTGPRMLARLCRPRQSRKRYRISSGAPTPSRASPEASTYTSPLNQGQPRLGGFWIILDNEA